MSSGRLEEMALGAGSDVNPLKSDAELVSLLKKLDRIKKYKSFQRWKTRFLDRLEQFLYEAGMEPAEKKCNEFDAMLNKFVKSANKVQDFIAKGDLNDNKKTVKASLALNEMCNSLTHVAKEIHHVIPSRSSEEKKCGFTKFHLGAVLIRQGFHQYIVMKAIEDALTDIGNELVHVADKQQHDLFADYSSQVQRFCDIMADLNLYEVMMKCLQFTEDPGDESSSEEPVTINISIECEDGTVLRLELDITESIGNIKEAIAEGCQIKPEKQVLKFNGNDLNEDAASLEALGVEDGAVLQVEPFRVPVTVNTMDGQTIQTKVDPDAYLSDIKKQLEGESGVPATNQRLYMQGEELADDLKTGNDYGIKAGSVIDLEPKSIHVTVETPDGQKHDLEIKPSDTADSIKEKIANATGMAVPRQVLKFNGNELPGDKMVKEMGIQEGSEIKVEVFKVPIKVNTLDGKQIQISVDPTAYVSDIKKALEPETEVPAPNQKLLMNGEELDDLKTGNDYGIKAGSELDMLPKSIKVSVAMPDGKKHEVEVSVSDTADDIKTKIEAQTGMAAPRQVLKLNGKELPSSQTAKDMGIQDGSEIKVEIFKVPVTVNTMDGKQIKVMIDPTAKMGDIKKVLEGKSGVPAGNQKIFMNGEELGDDDKAAADYGVKAGSELDLEPKVITVSVETPDGKKHDVDVKPSDTSDDIKKRIAAKTGMAAPRQVLKFNGDELPTDKTVKDMGMENGSVIKVEIFKVPITVNTMDGRTIKVMVDPTDKVIDIKKQLALKSEVPAKNQKLFLNGEELADDNKAASDYGVKAGSELDLEPKSIKVTVETPDGLKHEVEVKPSDTADDIKKNIAVKTEMAAPRQVLKFNGEELPAGKTVKDMGIKDGSEIKVEVFKVPVTVNTMDGKTIKVMVDPSDKLIDVKKQLAAKSGVPAKNQRLFLGGEELVDDSKDAGSCGIKAGSVLDLEPKIIKVSVETPDGAKHEVEVTPSDTADAVKAKIAKASGMAAPRQVLKVNGEDFSGGKTVKDMGIADGSEIKVDIFKIPITVKTHDGKTVSLKVEPCDTIDSIKKLLKPKTGMEPKKQCLKFGEDELKNGRSTAAECGIEKGSTLTLEPKIDPIIFVDIKCGTLFAVDRDVVIEKEALTPHQSNKMDFTEAAQGTAAREKILEVMKNSPNLGVATQVVVTKQEEVEDYDLQDADKVKNVWGVNLKKREKNKKGEEFIFVDVKTGACGELSRKKFVDMKFITPVSSGKNETIAEAEKDTMKYDEYIHHIRNVFGVKSAT